MLKRFLIVPACAACLLFAAAAASADDESSGSYRLRYDRGQSQLLEVPADAQKVAHQPDKSAQQSQRSSQSLKISPRKESSSRQLAKPGLTSANGAVTTVVGSLAVVLGLFAVVVWVSRRVGPQASAPLPKEAVELLGRTTISGQHSLQLMRVGGRILLVALSPHGAATLTEIVDAGEVERLTALCLRQRSGSSTGSFAQAMSDLERQPAARSFVDQRRPATSAAGNRPRTASFRT